MQAVAETQLLWLGALMTFLVPVVARADDIAAIVHDYDAYARVQDPVRAGQRGDRAALRRWPDDSPAPQICRTKAR